GAPCWQLWTVPDEHRGDRLAALVKRSERGAEMDRSVPFAKRSGEECNRTGWPRKRGRLGDIGTEAFRIGAPFELEHFRSRGPRRQGRGGRGGGGGGAAVGVTMRSARRQSRPRQRRIGSASSARSRSAFGDPG